MESDKIQEMQIIEQTLNNLIMQKNVFHMEISESESALTELDRSGDEVFKVIGQLMVRSSKEKVKKELEEKKKLLELRIKTLEKQENSLSEKLEKLRDEIMTKMKK